MTRPGLTTAALLGLLLMASGALAQDVVSDSPDPISGVIDDPDPFHVQAISEGPDAIREESVRLPAPVEVINDNPDPFGGYVIDNGPDVIDGVIDDGPDPFALIACEGPDPGISEDPEPIGNVNLASIDPSRLICFVDLELSFECFVLGR